MFLFTNHQYNSQIVFKSCADRGGPAFPGGFVEKNDYSGFDRNLWPKRFYHDHLKAIKKIEKCKSKTAKLNKERTLGWRFTPLTELEYFDSVMHHVIDPMHNLFLGTAKRMFKY